jgi:PAS domain S-box-containing protein
LATPIVPPAGRPNDDGGSLSDSIQLDFDFETSPLALALVAAGGEWVRGNGAFRAALGCTEDDIGGVPLRELLDARDVERVLAAMSPGAGAERVQRRVARLGRAPAAEKRLKIWKAGDGFDEPCCWWHVEDAALGTGAGGSDAREPESAELQRMRLQAVLDALPVGVFVTDERGRIREANRAALAIWGGRRPLADPEGHDLHRGWNAATKRPLEPQDWALSRAMATGRGFLDEEVEIECVDGTRKTILSSGLPIRNDDGRIVGGVAVHVDVSKLKAAQGAMLESERRYREIFESSRHAIFIIDQNGVIVDFNPAVLDLTGHTATELERLDVGAIIPDGERERLRESLEADGYVRDLEISIRHLDGTVIPARISASVRRGAEGRYVGYHGIVHDISDRKRVEEALRRQEEYFRSLIENANDVITVINADGTIRYQSPSLKRVLGWDPEEMAGKGMFDLVHPDDADGVQRALHAHMSDTGEGPPLEFRFRHSDGSWRVLESRGNNQLGNPAIDGIIANSRDVTTRREAEDALRDSTERLKILVESSPLAVVATDAEGSITHWSPAAERAFGWSADEVLGQPAPFVPADKHEERRALRERIFEGEVLRAVETRGVRKDGSVIWINLSAALLRGPRGEPMGVLSMIEDITARREREAQLRRAERLASLPTLVGGVAHELNNPLSAIKSFAQLLLLEEQPPENREALEIIHREAARATAVVSDLRQVVRDSRVDDAPEAVDLNEIVLHVIKIREYALRTHNIELRQDLARELPPVRASRRQMEQVVLNLFVNAEQALEEHRAARVLIVRTRQSSNGIALHVVDNGPGILPEHLGQIFDPFFTTKDPGRGMGLGLSLVHTLVTNLGGNVRVDSAVGRGAAFLVDLPSAADQPVAPTAPTPPPAAPTRSAVILVVDDEPAVRRSISRFLKRLGHSVDEAEDGEAALGKIRERHYDLVLSDVHMPGMGGRALLERLQSEAPEMIRRIGFLTGELISPEITAMLGTEEVPVLLKPFELSDVEALVNRFVPGA